jgi:hypothetical protein
LPIFGVHLYIYGGTPPVTCANNCALSPWQIVKLGISQLIDTITGQLHVCGCCIYGSDWHPFASVTITEVPEPLGIPEMVTVFPVTTAVPAVAVAVKGPVPAPIANVIE